MSLATQTESLPSTSSLYSSLEYLHPDLPIALKIFGYVIAAGVIVEVGVISTKAIVLGTLAYGAYVTAQKIYQSHSPVPPKPQQAEEPNAPIVHTDEQQVRVAVTVT